MNGLLLAFNVVVVFAHKITQANDDGYVGVGRDGEKPIVYRVRRLDMMDFVGTTLM